MAKSKKRGRTAGPARGITGPYTDSAGYMFCKADGRKVRFGAADAPGAQEAFEQFVRDWINRGCAWPAADEDKPPALTVAALAEDYIKHARAYYGAANREAERIGTSSRKLVEHFGTGFLVADLRPKQVLEFRGKLIADGYATAYVRDLVGVLKRMVRWAVIEDRLPADVHHALGALPVLKVGREGAKPPAQRLPVADDELAAVLPHLPPMLATAVQVLGLTGARPAELLSLKVKDLDRTGPVWVAKIERHKTAWKGKARVLHFGPAAQDLLRPLLRLDPEAHLFDPAVSEARRNEIRQRSRRSKRWVSHDPERRKARRGAPPIEYGPHYLPSALSKAVRRAIAEVNEQRKVEAVTDALRRAGVQQGVVDAVGKRLGRQTITSDNLPELLKADPAAAAHKAAIVAAFSRVSMVRQWCVYELRHRAAQRFRQQFGVEVARALLGHASTVTTEIYSTADLALASQAAGKLG